MVRTSIETGCSAVVPTSATTVIDTAGFGKVTLVVNITTANGGISAIATGNTTTPSTTTNKCLQAPDGQTVATTFTKASVGTYVVSYIGDDRYIKLTFANATVNILMSEPLRSY